MTLKMILYALLLAISVQILWPVSPHAQTAAERDAQMKQLVDDYLEKRTLEEDTQTREQEKEQLVKDIILNVAKGLAIVIALLVLRAIISAIGHGVAAEDFASIICVFITTPTEEEAEKITRELLDKDLVISGKITPPLRSIYRWQDQVEDEPEILILLKTRLTHVPEIIERVAVLHTYDVPDIIALPAHLTQNICPQDSVDERPWWKQVMGKD